MRELGEDDRVQIEFEWSEIVREVGVKG